MRYAFIRDNSRCWPVRLLCRVLDVHPGGFYFWLQQPHSQRHHADQMLTWQIKQFWLESGCVYGYRKIHLDLRDTGQQCGVNRVLRLMKRAGIKAQVGYRSPRARDTGRRCSRLTGLKFRLAAMVLILYSDSSQARRGAP